MRSILRVIRSGMVLLILWGSLALPPQVQAAGWRSKVDPWVLQTASQGETEFLIFLTEQADLSQAAKLATRVEKGAYVFETLSALAEHTQPPVRAALNKLGVSYRSYWVANMIWARGGSAVIQTLAGRADVAHVYANPRVHFDEPVALENLSPASTNAIEWNISWVNADDVWAAGYTGQGVVIGGQDTGYEWNHPALINHYRGWNGSVANHHYNWHDATGGSPAVPVDPYGHGTHTMGTMVGADGGVNQIGMAPGAQWIGCRNMDSGGNGTPQTYAGCYQWFIAPTDLNNANPNPALAPDVINNSWACPASEGCTDPTVLLSVVQAVRAAGIVTVHSAGNSGSSCGSINTPAALYDESFTVGATGDHTDEIAGFSSRGPSTYGGNTYPKPNISAPGVNIRSSVRGGGYQGGWNGTSMAAPHVAGAAALLISANPSLAGDVDRLESLLEQSALPRTTTQTCGGVPGSQVPNNTYGWGRMDVWAAYQLMKSQELGISKTGPAFVLPQSPITYTITLNYTGLLPIHGVVLTDIIPINTTFITATLPYTLTGSLVEWSFSALNTGQLQVVSLAVQTPISFTGVITNSAYGVRCDDFLPVVLGLPVSTHVTERIWYFFLPFVSKSTE